MKFIVYFLALWFPFIPFFGSAAITEQESIEISPINCAPELQKALIKILHVPQARQVIAAIQAEGPFSILVKNHMLSDQFGAFWDQNARLICVSLSSNASEGEVIGSILFEMQNARQSAKFDHFDRLALERKIGKDFYVEAVEYIEYENSLKAAEIAQKGIDLGIFPADARLMTYQNFEQHFYFQKVGGHSAWIARNFDHLTASAL